jgi:hypothetical protein
VPRVTRVEELNASGTCHRRLLTVSQLVRSLDRWSRALLPAKYLRFSSLFLPAAAKLSELPVRFMPNPFCRRVIAGGKGVLCLPMGVAFPGVPMLDTGGATDESSAIQKIMVSAKL